MNLTLKVWRQENAEADGRFETYEARDVDADMSFLEMLDVVNEGLIEKGKDPIAFDSDCREGICGTCSMVIGRRAARRPQGHHRLPASHAHFKDGDTVTVEPWRAKPFPGLRTSWSTATPSTASSQAGGFVSVNTGGAPDANALPISKDDADEAMDAAACIGCGACVAACKNASASLFVSAKVSQLAMLPQGQVERRRAC